MSNTAEWINELWYTFTTEYYKTVKNHRLQLHSTTWITNGRSKIKEYIKYDYIYIKVPKHMAVNYMDVSGAYRCTFKW